MEMRERVREFIVGNFYVSDGPALREDTSLRDQGIVDSTGVLELIAFLETEFGLQVADEEMLPENLDSIAQICAYVARKRAASDAAA